MRERGFIAIARGILDHPVVGASKPYRFLEAWLWLLQEAAWKPRRVRVTNGRSMAVVSLARGQLTHSRSYMAVAWGWSEKRVRTFLSRLEKEGQIDLQKGQPQMVISICKYDDYQLGGSQEGRQTGQQSDRQQAGNGPEEEQGKKGRKDNMRRPTEEPEGFAAWYDLYPRKKARKAAARAYAKCVPTDILATELIERTKRFAAQWAKRQKADLQFCKYPGKWLDDGEFNDDDQDHPGDVSEIVKISLPTRRAQDFTDSEWQGRLAMHRRGDRWAERHWGPAPGQPGCLVPAKLLGRAAPITSERRSTEGALGSHRAPKIRLGATQQHIQPCPLTSCEGGDAEHHAPAMRPE